MKTELCSKGARALFPKSHQVATTTANTLHREVMLFIYLFFGGASTVLYRTVIVILIHHPPMSSNQLRMTAENQ